MSTSHAILLVLGGVGAGIFNGVAGGGSLISFPLLLALGYPALTANITNTVGIWPGYLASAAGYRREIGDQRSRLLRLSPVALAGGIAGAALLLTTSETTFENVVPWLVLGAAALFAVQPVLRRALDRGSAHPRTRPVLLVVGVFAASVYGGYFGAAMGVMFLAVLGLALPLSIAHTSGLRAVLSMIVNGIAAVVFVVHGGLAWEAAGWLALGSLFGGFAGLGLRSPCPRPRCAWSSSSSAWARPSSCSSDRSLGRPEARSWPGATAGNRKGRVRLVDRLDEVRGRTASKFESPEWAQVIFSGACESCPSSRRQRVVPDDGTLEPPTRHLPSRQRFVAGDRDEPHHRAGAALSEQPVIGRHDDAHDGIAAERRVVRQKDDRVPARRHLDRAGDHAVRIELGWVRARAGEGSVTLGAQTEPDPVRIVADHEAVPGQTLQRVGPEPLGMWTRDDAQRDAGTTPVDIGSVHGHQVIAERRVPWSGKEDLPARSGPGPIPESSSLAQLPNAAGPTTPPATER